MAVDTSSVATPAPERVAYPAPAEKWAKHARKRCQACGVLLQGRYWLLDQWSWVCLPDGDRLLAANEVLA